MAVRTVIRLLAAAAGAAGCNASDSASTAMGLDANVPDGNTAGHEAEAPVLYDGGAEGQEGNSCNGLPDGCDNESCCTSLLVPGGSFFRSYDGVYYTDRSYPATVSDFRLDKYEVTRAR